MFSEKAWKIFHFRLIIMGYGFSTPFRWDHENKRLCRSGNYSYYNFGMYHLYTIFGACFLTLKLVIRSAIQTIPIPGEEEQNHDNFLKPILTAIDIILITLFTGISFIILGIRIWTDEIIYFFNSLIKCDQLLHGMLECFKLQFQIN